MSFELKFPPNIPQMPALTRWLQDLFFAIIQDRSDSLAGRVVIETIVLQGSMGVSQETPTPATDGATVLFYCLSAYQSGQLHVYRDQSLLIRGIDYTETSPTLKSFTMTTAPDSDETLRVSYIKSV